MNPGAELSGADLFELLAAGRTHELRAVCTLTHKRGGRFNVLGFHTADSATEHELLEGWPQDRHVYVEINPTDVEHVPARGRSDEISVVRLSALFVDLDVKPGGFTDTAAAWSFVDKLEAAIEEPPSAVVETGSGGLQALWLVADAPTRTVDEAARAQALLEGWRRLVTRLAPDGVALDSVFDLPRIMRLPGTRHLEPGSGDGVVRGWRGPGDGLALPVWETRVADALGERPSESNGTPESTPEAAETKESTPEAAQAYADLPAALQRRSDALRDRILARLADELEEAGQWADDPAWRNDKGKGWRAITLDAAFTVARLVVTPWIGLDKTAGVAALNGRLPRAMREDTAVASAARITDATLERAARRPLEDPPWSGEPTGASTDFDVVPGGAVAGPGPLEKGAAAAEEGGDEEGDSLRKRLRARVLANYDIFPVSPNEARVYAQHKRGGRAEEVTKGFITRVADPADLDRATFTRAAKDVADVITDTCLGNPVRELSLRCATSPGRIVLDLGRRGDSTCVIVTADGWELADRPPSEIVFANPGYPLPLPERGGSLEELRELLGWDPEEPRWLLVKGWLVVAMRDGIVRPLLGLFGPQGSAKTTTGRFVASVLDPRPPSVLGGRLKEHVKEEDVMVMTTYIPAWDNISKVTPEQSDFLAMLATGYSVTNRKLFTDSGASRVSYKRTGVLTGLAIPRGVKPDAMDRILHIPVPPMESGARMGEEVLDQRWTIAHPRVLAGVLDLASGMLDRLEEATMLAARHRLQDYVTSLYALDPAAHDAFIEATADTRLDAAMEDPFIQTLVSWLAAEDGGAGDFEGTAEAIRKSAGEHLPDMWAGGDGTWWPRNARSFTEHLTINHEVLRAVGVTVGRRKSNGIRLTRLHFTDSVESVTNWLHNREADGQDG